MANDLEGLFRRLINFNRPEAIPQPNPQMGLPRSSGPQWWEYQRPDGLMGGGGRSAPKDWFDRIAEFARSAIGEDVGFGPTPLTNPLGMAKLAPEAVWEMLQDGKTTRKLAQGFAHAYGLGHAVDELEGAAMDGAMKLVERAPEVGEEGVKAYLNRSMRNSMMDFAKERFPERQFAEATSGEGEALENVAERLTDTPSNVAPARAQIVEELSKEEEIEKTLALNAALKEKFEREILSKMKDPIGQRAAMTILQGKPLSREEFPGLNTAQLRVLRDNVKTNVETIQRTGMSLEEALQRAIVKMPSRTSEDKLNRFIATRAFLEGATTPEIATELKSSHTYVEKLLKQIQPSLVKIRDGILVKAAGEKKNR